MLKDSEGNNFPPSPAFNVQSVDYFLYSDTVWEFFFRFDVGVRNSWQKFKAWTQKLFYFVLLAKRQIPRLFSWCSINYLNLESNLAIYSYLPLEKKYYCSHVPRIVLHLAEIVECNIFNYSFLGRRALTYFWCNALKLNYYCYMQTTDQLAVEIFRNKPAILPLISTLWR